MAVLSFWALLCEGWGGLRGNVRWLP